MIAFDRVTLTYPGATTPALGDISVHIPEGELCLVVGPTGAGKTSLLGAATGRVPHFTGGVLEGRVLIDGRDTAAHLPRHLADVVGVVMQDPLHGFVADTVEEELAFALEQLGLPQPVMRSRVEEVLDLLDLAPLRSRALTELSGGEQQRVAIGAVMTAQPKALVLDEPTSALDPTAAEEVLAALTRLVHDLGVTVLLAEHRLERVVQFADSVLNIRPDGTATYGAPAQVLGALAHPPPVVELGRLAGWDPLPLSIRDARRHARGWRSHLPPRPDTPPAPAEENNAKSRATTAAKHDGALLRAHKVRVSYGPVTAVNGVDLQVGAGEILAIMGRNGSGKSSLLWALQGLGPRSAGQVRLPAAPGAPDPADLTPAHARRHIALVPQTPSHLLYHDTVAAECAAADADAAAASGTTARILADLVPDLPEQRHPGDLSEGGRLALALAVQLAADPPVLLLDEPTRGLDYRAKENLAGLLTDRAASGRAVILTSHDVEFVARTATRVLTLAQGEVVADGPARQILTASATLAPQVAKILHPLDYLTVAEVETALGGRS